ncbi:hypothetical protein BHE74_00056132 [Ensete ventricosum]|nr:hypothetical protein BHE74_00056132 [Ensete ventricosum]
MGDTDRFDSGLVRMVHISLLVDPTISCVGMVWYVSDRSPVGILVQTNKMNHGYLFEKSLPMAKIMFYIADNIISTSFTGIDDPYEPPLNCEIEIKQENGVCPSPNAMAGQVVGYLEEKGFLQE